MEGLSISGKVTKMFITTAKATPADRFPSPVCPSSQHVWPQMGDLLLGWTIYPVWFTFVECDNLKTCLSEEELPFKSFAGFWTALWPDLALWQYWVSV